MYNIGITPFFTDANSYNPLCATSEMQEGEKRRVTLTGIFFFFFLNMQEAKEEHSILVVRQQPEVCRQAGEGPATVEGGAQMKCFLQATAFPHVAWGDINSKTCTSEQHQGRFLAA